MENKPGIKYYETQDEIGLHFCPAIDPQILIDTIKKLESPTYK